MRAFLFVALLIAGCATTSGGDMNAAKVTWAGVTYDNVVTRWGQPAYYTTLSDDRYVYTWVSENVEPRGAVYPSLSFLGGSGGGVGIGTGVAIGPGGGAIVRCSRTL